MKNKETELAMKNCSDRHCPFHAHWKLRGRVFTGTIIKKDAHHTVTIEWPRLYYLKKYERFEKRRTRVKAHNPLCINAEIGNHVKIMESKPISKTKAFVIIEKK